MGQNSDAPGAAFSDVLRAAQAGAGWAFERLYTHLAPAVGGYLRMQRAAEPRSTVPPAKPCGSTLSWSR